MPVPICDRSCSPTSPPVSRLGLDAPHTTSSFGTETPLTSPLASAGPAARPALPLRGGAPARPCGPPPAPVDEPIDPRSTLVSPLARGGAVTTLRVSETSEPPANSTCDAAVPLPMASSPRRPARRMERPPPLAIPTPSDAPRIERALCSLDSVYALDSAPTCVDDVVDYLDDDVEDAEDAADQRFLEVLDGVHSEMGRIMDEVYRAEAAVADMFSEMDRAVDSARALNEQYEILHFQEEMAGARFRLATNVLRRLQVGESDAEGVPRAPDASVDADFGSVVRRLQEQRDDGLSLTRLRRSLHVPPADSPLTETALKFA
ncbi:Uncharacterized protein MSYG_3532 [Malassezia sympodialis ATCC 42132]|uniref:Uncharacterized protein n=1 Tax=Malassezia sympodialis (strain ATCC 42132) TaxID=1230383 RepID=A0A1M8AA04_MALS4|nr:Uncharacterized protein MSYG_3532 [Malassezia sympodialis ATCC 42132]